MQTIRNIEFFNDPEGGVMVRDTEGVHTYQPEDKMLTGALFTRIETEYPKALCTHDALNGQYTLKSADVQTEANRLKGISDVECLPVRIWPHSLNNTKHYECECSCGGTISRKDIFIQDQKVKT